MRRRQAIGPALIAVVVVVALVVAVGPGRARSPETSASPGPAAPPRVSSRGSRAVAGPGATADRHATARRPSAPVPGHELFGFVPYWEMNDGIAAHLAQDAADHARPVLGHAHEDRQDRHRRRPATSGSRAPSASSSSARRTTAASRSSSSTRASGPRATSGSSDRTTVQDATIASLVALAAKIDVDGINVDVEQLGAELVPAYGAFVGRLREALRAKVPDAQVSVATTAGRTGAADGRRRGGRRRRPDLHDGLRLSLRRLRRRRVGTDGPPRRRGGRPAVVARPVRVARRARSSRRSSACRCTGCAGACRVRRSARRGSATARSGSRPTTRSSSPTHRRRPVSTTSRSSSSTPSRRPSARCPAIRARPPAGRRSTSIRPTTLRPKLALADERGLAGAGFWAIGYERGLAGYRDLMKDFRAGTVE